MNEIRMHNARTGEPGAVIGEATTEAEVAQACSSAASAFEWLSSRSRSERRELLRTLAEGLEGHADELVRVADIETALGETRLRGELARTAYQLRFMGDVALDGGYLDVSIEHPVVGPLGPVADIRRTSVPIGPVAVFGSSNFPFAFSAPGGDTASALAAGCSVVVKAHSSHPALASMVNDIFGEVLRTLGAPQGVFTVVHGRSAGQHLVVDPRITAVGFTGSVSGGRQLFDMAASRPTPIPFYGELGSVNPFVVTQAAAIANSGDIATGLAASMTQGLGQFCTKPGIFLIPTGSDGDHLVSELSRLVDEVHEGHLLNESITQSFITGVQSVTERRGVQTLVADEGDGRTVSPVLVAVGSSDLIEDVDGALREERFGPFGMVVRFDDLLEVERILRSLPPALTGTVHMADATDEDGAAIVRTLAKQSGRVVINGYPTGVAVNWGMNHGGQYPSSTSTSTSVGAESIRRWIRPVAFQNAPESVLPPELWDSETTIPRRVDGKVVARA